MHALRFLMRLGLFALAFHLTILPQNTMAAGVVAAAVTRDAKIKVAQTLVGEIPHGGLGKAEELRLYLEQNPEIIVDLVSGLSPAAVSDTLKLDSFRQFFRGYKDKYGDTLLQLMYRVDEEQFINLLDVYLKDKMITPDELDLTRVNLDSFDALSPEHKKEFFANYRNQRGQNLLHLIDSSDFEKVISDSRVVSGLWIQPDKFGVTPLMAFAAKSFDFSKKLAELRSKGINVDQKDAYGNTAEMIYRARKYENPDRILAARYFAQRDFNDLLWQSIKDDPYFPYIKWVYSNPDPMQGEEFVEVALRTVLAQPQTPLRRAFLQQDVTAPEQREAANASWRSFLGIYDTMLDPEGAAEKQKLPLSIRALDAISDTGRSRTLPDLRDTSASIISGASSFGVKFKKATQEEAKVLVRGIEAFSMSSTQNCYYNSLGQHLGLDVFGDNLDSKISKIGDHLRAASESPDETDEDDLKLINSYLEEHPEDFQGQFEKAYLREVGIIKKAFIKPYHAVLDLEKTQRLFRHQLKCTVFALSSFNRYLHKFGYRKFIDEYEGLDLGKVMDFIDETLKDVVPAGTLVSSGALLKNVMQHSGEDVDFD